MYARAVPLDLLKAEQSRIGSELADAKQSLDEATRAVRSMEAHVDATLTLLTNADVQYRAADSTGRQLMNQAVFETIEAAQMHPGVADLVSDDLAEQLRLDQEEVGYEAGETDGRAVPTQVGPGSRTDTRGVVSATPTFATDPTNAVTATAPFIARLLCSGRSERIPGHRIDSNGNMEQIFDRSGRCWSAFWTE
ncbi:MAG: hypothetical protein FWH11_00660 [Micrococcales bacterium]|nr:hypothetical protein [Micrococcales bacterium]